MATIKKLIDSGEVVLGKTRVVWDKVWFVPHWVSAEGNYVCQNQSGGIYVTFPREDKWKVYVEPVEMEDRWLWAHPRDHDVTRHTYTKPYDSYTIKLEWSRTSFPKKEQT